MRLFALLALLTTTVPSVLSSQQIQMGDTNQIKTNTGKPSLSDLLTLQSSSSIFFTYARETELSRLFSQESSGISVLVPTNKAVMALPRKPNNTPVDPNIRITAAAYERLSKDSVKRWVSAHIIPASPLEFTPGESISYDTLLPEKSITFEQAQGQTGWQGVTVDKRFKIVDVKVASNGLLYIVDGSFEVSDENAIV